MRDTFIFYRSFMEAFDSLNSEEAGIMYKAVVHYALNGEEPQLKGYLDSMWKLIQPIVKRDRILYENGTKGGRPKNQNETKPKPKENQNETKPKPILSNDKDKDKDKDIEKKDTTVSSKKRFVKPTYQQVLDYCNERGNGIDPAKFIDHYEAKGWLIGKQPMKDWRAAVRTWERNHQSSPSDAQAINTAVPQVPEWRVLEEGNPNNPPAKEWAAFLEYLDKKNSPLVITGPQYMKVKVMAQYDKQDFRRVINDLIRMAPIQTSIEQEADHLLDAYRIDPNYQAPINPKSNQEP